MTNYLKFFASCGHFETKEVSDDEWLRFAYETHQVTNAIGIPVGPNYWVMASDLSSRMVYVHPARFSTCWDCFKGACDDGLM